MSDLAEYAKQLQEKESVIFVRQLEPVDYPSHCEKLTDIRAIICDVYGTLVNYWRPGFETKESRAQKIEESFKKISDRFGMTPFLAELNPAERPEKTLSDFYNGLIALNHEKAAKKGVAFPEVKIEDIWSLIILILKRRGYNPSHYLHCSESEFSRYLAFTYNFLSLGRQLYPGIVTTLERLKASNIVIGIVSNAQFYTPIDLTLFIREQSEQQIDDFSELFESDLTFFSYEYGVAKPNQLMFRKLFDALYEYHILPSQTVFVGNDLRVDIQPAIEAGMRTALFTGDKESLYTHDLGDSVVPDITFQNWEELPSKISFYSEENQK